MVAGTISYDGSIFYGFQAQKHTKKTVESRLCEALKAVGMNPKIIASGRTDTGVHATGQVIAFEVKEFWDLRKLQFSLNRLLKNEIVFKSLQKVADDFHPRYNARSRTYRYLIFRGAKSPFLRNYALFDNPDLKRLKEALSLFSGKIDLSFFHKTGSNQTSTIREFFRSFAYEYKNYIVVCIEASGFLRSSVRLIVAACLAYAKGDISKHELLAQIRVQKKIVTHPAIPNGLYLSRVRF